MLTSSANSEFASTQSTYPGTEAASQEKKVLATEKDSSLETTKLETAQLKQEVEMLKPKYSVPVDIASEMPEEVYTVPPKDEKVRRQFQHCSKCGGKTAPLPCFLFPLPSEK